MPRTDDLLPSHPGEPYAYGQPKEPERAVEGSVPDVGTSGGPAIPPGTITKPLFQTGLTPVEILGSLPGLPSANYPQGSVVFLTTDNKLYRSTGTVWTLAVPTTDLTGQITTGQLVDGAVNAAKLADNGVILNKLSGDIQYIFAPYREDFSQPYGDRWTQLVGTGTTTQPQVSDSQFGGKVWRIQGYTAWMWNKNIPFDPNVLYRIKIRIRQTIDPSSGGKQIYFGVKCFQADGVTATHTNAGEFYVAAGGATVAAGSSWTEFTGYFKGTTTDRAGEPANNPATPGTADADTRYFRPLLYVNYANGDGTVEIDMIEFSVDALSMIGTAAASGLGVDGTVAANKVIAASILAGAVITAKLDAGAVTTAKLAAGAVTANEIAANTITAAKIAALTITAAEIATDAITANKILAGAVTAAKIAVSQLDAISANMGSITAGSIEGVAITVKGILRILVGNSSVYARAGGVILRSSNLSVVDNAVYQTALSYTLKANSLQNVGDSIRTTVRGTMTAAASQAFGRVKVALAGTTLVERIPTGTGAATINFVLETITTKLSNNNQVTHSSFSTTNDAYALTRGTTAITDTSDQTLTVEFRTGVASPAGNSVIIDTVLGEYLSST